MDYVLHMLDRFLIMAMAGVSLNLLLGFTGLMSMSHAAFFGLGAYGSALLATNAGASFPVATLAGIAAAAVVGALTAIPALRVKGEYLILLTLAVQMVVWSAVMGAVGLTGGPSGLTGIPRPELFGLKFLSPGSYLPLLLVFTVLVMAISWRVAHSPFGRVLKAMRNDQLATRSLGKNVLVFQVLVFVVAGCLVALAGSLQGFYATVLSPSDISVDVSVLMIAIVFVGGAANLWGSVVQMAPVSA